MKEWKTPEVTEIEFDADEDVLASCLTQSQSDAAPFCQSMSPCPH